MYTEVKTIDQAFQTVKDLLQDGYKVTISQLNNGDYAIRGTHN